MSRYLLDTNHCSAAIRRVSPLRDCLLHLAGRGDRFATCASVLCELEAGIQQVADVLAARRRLRHVLQRVRVWPIDFPLTTVFGTIYLELRRAGRILSHVDMLLAALARDRDAIILTTDRDFDALPDIRTENWLIVPPTGSGTP